MLTSFSCIGQSSIFFKGENINSIDENGNKIGLWKLYDESNNVKITIDFSQSPPLTKFFKDEKLIAAFDRNKRLEIYKGSGTIKANYFYNPNGSQTLVNENDQELDLETISYYTQAAEVRAMYYGGINELFAFIGQNFNSKGQSGSVKVKFMVDCNGFTSQVEIVESSNPQLNDEAVRVISISPRWQPSHQGGDFVKTPFIIPINIK